MCGDWLMHVKTNILHMTFSGSLFQIVLKSKGMKATKKTEEICFSIYYLITFQHRDYWCFHKHQSGAYLGINEPTLGLNAPVSCRAQKLGKKRNKKRNIWRKPAEMETTFHIVSPDSHLLPSGCRIHMFHNKVLEIQYVNIMWKYFPLLSNVCL